MSANQQVEQKSEVQFRIGVSSQRHVIGPRVMAGGRIQVQNSQNQSSGLLQELTQPRPRSGERLPADPHMAKAKPRLRQRLLSAFKHLCQGPESAGTTTPRTRQSRSRKQSVAGRHRSQIATPASAPLVQVLISAPCRHVITFTHSGCGGSQPAGTSGAEIYIAVREQTPVDHEGFRFAAWAIRSPHLLQFSEADAGRTAHYRLRWINAKGESGPWSNTVTALIPAVAEAVEIA